jgi:PDZ domain
VIVVMKVHFKQRRILLAIWLLVALVACGSARAEDGQIVQWIAQLDGNQYQVREEATRHLLDTGTDALDALMSAANGDRPEPADRAVWILQQLADTQDAMQRQTVLEHLIQLKNQPQVVADAQVALGEIKNDAAVRAIQKLGGRVLEQTYDPRWPQQMHQQVTIDDNWRGHDEGLKYITDLRDVGTVTVIRSNVSRQGLEQLKGIDTLERLQLYGTPLEEADKVALARAMPSVEIDFRRGALLGIRGPEAGAAQVLSVQPGTAAAAAGIRVKDTIQKFNGKPVADFKELTSMIAGCREGEEVSLEILRDGKSQDLKVKLGRWETL